MAPNTSKLSAQTGGGYPLPLPMHGALPKAAPKPAQVKKANRPKEAPPPTRPEGIEPFSPTSSMPGAQDTVVWPGGYVVGLAPDRTVPKAKATPVPKASDAKKVPSRGRRRATEAFKGPIKKIINHHLIEWLDIADPTFLGMDVTKDLDRPHLMLLVGFAFGWGPDYIPVQKDPDLFKTTARNEYLRRGEPAKSTRWTPGEICLFMKHRLSKLQPHDDIGVFAHRLPRSMGITPAPFPVPVLEWEKEQRKNSSTAKRQPPPPPAETERKAKSRRSEPETLPSIIPTQGYKAEWDKTKKTWFLMHADMEQKVPVETSTKAKPKIYLDESGSNEVVWGGGDLAPYYCQTLFEDFRASQQKSTKPSMMPMASRPVQAMRGMTQAASAAPSLETLDDQKDGDERVPEDGDPDDVLSTEHEESEEEAIDGEALEDTPETVEMAAPPEPPIWERPFLQELGGKFGTVMVDPVKEVFVPLKKGCPDYHITPSFVDGHLRGYVVDSASHGYQVTPYWSHMLASSRRAQEASKSTEVQGQIAALKSQNPSTAVPPPGTPHTPKHLVRRTPKKTPSPKTHASPFRAMGAIPGTGDEKAEGLEDQNAEGEQPRPTDAEGLEEEIEETKDDEKEEEANKEADDNEEANEEANEEENDN